jgi:hypothetical protein
MKHVRELFHPSVRLVAQCVGIQGMGFSTHLDHPKLGS